jgi:hypothetical protein
LREDRAGGSTQVVEVQPVATSANSRLAPAVSPQRAQPRD